ncbi:MAG: acetyl-CoA acetyltransferase, partial [Mycobacterium sp.]
MPVDPRTPVLIGYGQVNHHEERAPEENAIEPVDLMAAAARQAADSRVLEAVDAVRVVHLFSAHYRDPGLLLGERIGADRPATRYSGMGGNVPQSLVNQACLDIQHGRAGVVLLAGAEMWRTRMRLRANGRKLTWTRQDESVAVAEGSDEPLPMAGPAEERIGLDRPAYMYTLFE